MAVKVNAVSEMGGAVELNFEHRAWASYAVAGVAGAPPIPLMYAGITLRDGRNVSLFVNRDTGLVTLDIGDADGKGGREVFREMMTPPLTVGNETRANDAFQGLSHATAKKAKSLWRKPEACSKVLTDAGLDKGTAELVAYWLMLQNS